MSRKASPKSLVAGLLLIAAGFSLHAATISVDPFHLVSHGTYDDSLGLFEVNSLLDVGLKLSGGDKFAAVLRLEYLSGSVEDDLYQNGLILTSSATTDDIVSKLNASTGLALRTAAVSTRNIGGSGFEATYFVGYMDSICTGDDFVTLFGDAPFSTDIRGPLYYPNGVGGDKRIYYDGLDAVYGTGARLGHATEHRAVFFYVFQNSDLGAGAWSGLARGLLDSEKLKLELYGGFSAGTSYLYGLFRCGFLLDFSLGPTGEFFAQMGIPHLNPTEQFSIDNLFFLFEPRFSFDPFSFAFTVFCHPAYYREKATGEGGALDFCLNAKYGSLATTGYQVGLSSLAEVRQLEAVPLTIDIAPYISIISWGLEWNIKLDCFVFPWGELYEVFSPYIGIRTSF